MISNFAKSLLVLTAFAPVLLTLAFTSLTRRHDGLRATLYLGSAALLAVVCVLIVREAARRLEPVRFQVKSIRTADREILAFVLTYLLPFATTTRQVDASALWFVLGLLGAIVWTTHAYHFNPLLGLFGLHFYEVTADGGVTFVLVTRRTLRTSCQITEVVQVTDYIVLDRTSFASPQGDRT